MVFPEIRLHPSANRLLVTAGICLITLATASGCSSRGEKKVSVQCSPGQTQAADGTCQAKPASPSGPINDPNQTPTGAEPPFTEQESVQPQEQEETTLLPPGTQDQPTPQPQTQQPQQPLPQQPLPQQPQPQQPLPQQPQPQPQQPQNPGQPGTPGTGVDQLNQSETVTTLFNNAPKTAADGAPLLALKLVTSAEYGKVARVAFSYSTGVTNAEFKYHKKVLAVTGTPFNSDGSLQLEFSSIPVSVTFDWENKRCDSGVVEVGFVAKTATATCK